MGLVWLKLVMILFMMNRMFSLCVVLCMVLS